MGNLVELPNRSQINLQVDHGGQRLHFVDLIFEVLQSCPPSLPFLPNSHQAKQNWADSGTTVVKSAKPSPWPPWSPYLYSIKAPCTACMRWKAHDHSLPPAGFDVGQEKGFELLGDQDEGAARQDAVVVRVGAGRDRQRGGREAAAVLPHTPQEAHLRTVREPGIDFNNENIFLHSMKLLMLLHFFCEF